MVYVEQPKQVGDWNYLEKLAIPLRVSEVVNPLHPSYPNFKVLAGEVVFPKPNERQLVINIQPGAVVLRKEFHKEYVYASGKTAKALDLVQLIVVKKSENGVVHIVQVTLDYQHGTVEGGLVKPKIIEGKFVNRLPQDIEVRLENGKTKTNMSFFAEIKLSPKLIEAPSGQVLHLDIPK